jgi:hypothetical protein
MSTVETTTAALAGYVVGRGGFGRDKGRYWVYFFTLDHEIAATALDLWGGHITERRTSDGKSPQYKYVPDNETARRVLEEMAPYLMGEKRRYAAELLEDHEVGTLRIEVRAG